MPELVEQMYCSQQIVIPPKFPYLLKRYCKAAIKTQPYDLLRWSFEYFKALSEHRPPPVKLRLEYPVYSTEGGLTRGCLKVLANQLAGQTVLPLELVKSAWQGFCLDPEELKRILCLCEVHMRAETVPFLAFIAVAGGLLTKSLTHTMILLCETLTKEPDGGSAAICVHDFVYMYRFLAKIDASSNVRYIDGFREGLEPPRREPEPEDEESVKQEVEEEESEDDFWHSSTADLQKLMLIDDKVSKTARLSVKLQAPLLGKIERSPSAERAGEIEREKYMRDYKVKPHEDEEVNKALRQISAGMVHSQLDATKEAEVKKEEAAKEELDMPGIKVFDEEDKPQPFEFYGEPQELEVAEEETKMEPDYDKMEEEAAEEEPTEKQKLQQYINTLYQAREERRIDLELTFDEISQLVDRFKSTNYDLGMVAGRQMSITSGEFIVQHIEREIMEFIDEQIAILPDPDLQKKKAKPEEKQMIKDLVWNWLNESMAIIVPEVEEVEEEEEVVPDVVMVYAVPGIGPSVDDDIVRDVEDFAYDVCRVQADVVMPRNIRHFMCPPLEKYLEPTYDDDSSKHRKEQCPTVGALTD